MYDKSNIPEYEIATTGLVVRLYGVLNSVTFNQSTDSTERWK
jgi:hypothetical protein